jgi:hypothetical protein
MATVLIAGVPRSGTTWVGRVLGHTGGAVYVNEPDGDHDPFAFRARLGHETAPVLAPGARDTELERLWTGALAGGRYAGTRRDRLARALYARTPVPDRWEAWLGGRVSAPLQMAARLAVPRVAIPDARHVVVKSVRTELALEWLVERFRPRVLVVERNPLNVLASWIELDFVRDPREAAAVAEYARDAWGLAAPAPDASQLERQTFYFGVLASAVHEAAARHPDWVVTRHDDLCLDPATRFAALAAVLGLEWTDDAARFLDESDREGTGYDTARSTADQPDRWRGRLDDAQVATIRATLASFPVALLDGYGSGTRG